VNSQYHLADVLAVHLAQYRQQFSLNYQQQKVCKHIAICRTEKLGVQNWRCDHCDYQQLHYCSCRDRHCPRCQGQQTQAWIEQQQTHIINSPYFHLVFTLPHELNIIAHYNEKALYDALFQSVWQTLSKFAINRKSLRGQLGVTAVLHTWGQTLTQHIHLHCLIPGGVINSRNNWVSVDKPYLFPVKALSKVFRGKMLDALKARNITLPQSLTLMQKPWCVYSKSCLHHPSSVLKYLARYTRKGMLHESRLRSITSNAVQFDYKDYRDSQNKVMTLTGVEFIRRYLLHVLPKGYMRIRHFGFLANACRRKKLKLINEQLPEIRDRVSAQNKGKQVQYCWPCPKCHQGILQLNGLILPITEKIPKGCDEVVFRLTG